MDKKIVAKGTGSAVVTDLAGSGLPPWARKHETRMGSASPLSSPDLPALIKVDLNTPLESFFSGLAGIMVLLICFFLFGGILGGKRTPPNPALLKHIPWALIVGAIAWYLRSTTDNYYVIDTRRKTIFYHFETLLYISLRPYLSASEVFTVGVTGWARSSKHRNWHEYKIVLITKKGDSIDFSDFGEEDYFEKNARAEEIALALGCRHIPAEDGSRLEICRSPSGELQVFSTTDPEGIVGSDVTLVGCLQVIGLVVMVCLILTVVYHFS